MSVPALLKQRPLSVWLFFYQFYNRFEKAFFVIVGVIWIYVANLIRLMSVIMLVHFFGADIFFFAHSILGRIIFYVLIITLYYNVFTFSQISHSLYRSVNKMILQAWHKLKERFGNDRKNQLNKK
ncbi:archaeosortase/exosortase family protein [Secundilactobacillus malefermentans]|uniref:archaeosortase/exosortase family protein n=1 Tax=Secundilactobacillus malefermentans TaxID=176292 RepID=UPI001CDC089A|nr:archaeosortase/exosortase family protein [Secundilactobacillus malefermentans]